MSKKQNDFMIRGSHKNKSIDIVSLKELAKKVEFLDKTGGSWEWSKAIDLSEVEKDSIVQK